MDHKWGRNVLAYGVGGLGATLAARENGGGDRIVLNVKRSDGAFLNAFYLPPDMGLPYAFGWTLPLPGFPHFPYGVDVEPDGPV